MRPEVLWRLPKLLRMARRERSGLFLSGLSWVYAFHVSIFFRFRAGIGVICASVYLPRPELYSDLHPFA